MKNLIIIISLLAIVAGCKKAVVDPSEDPILYVANEMQSVIVEEGVISNEIDISAVFKVHGSADAVIFKSIHSVQNPALVQAEITGDVLNITTNIGVTGSSEIVLRAEWSTSVVLESFIFTVNGITSSAALNKAIQYFQAADYTEAGNYFNVVISKNENGYLSDAYMGLGFSQLRNDDAPNGFQNMQTSLVQNASNTDAKAGMALLEYAYMKNFSEALRYSQEVYSAAPQFVFRYDSNLDYHDILVTMGLSQYSLQDYNSCLATVQILDPAYVLSPTDPDFGTKLLQKLEALVLLYR